MGEASPPRFASAEVGKRSPGALPQLSRIETTTDTRLTYQTDQIEEESRMGKRRVYGLADCMDEAKENAEYDEDTGSVIGRVYLGSLINPSGKFYMPFASSNADICPHCGGEGTLRNARFEPKRSPRENAGLQRQESRLLAELLK